MITPPADLAPLYRRVSRNLEGRIREGTLGPGAALASEARLCAEFGVSRITVRRAIEELVQRRLVVRRRGVGTFVNTPGESVKSVVLTGFIEDAVPLNRMKVQRETIEPLPPEAAALAEVREFTPMKCITSVNHLPEGPLSYARFFFPDEIAQLFSAAELGGPVSPISLVEARSGQAVHHATQIVEAATADRLAARHLGIAPGTPVLRILRVYFSGSGALLEAFDALYHPTRYRYAATLVPRPG